MPVTYTVENRIALITLDRPEAHNAIDLEMWNQLSEVMERFEADPDALVGIVVGAGEKAFCAGADVKSTIKRLFAQGEEPYSEPATIMRGQTVTKPLIAAINGLALGGGLEIALACDIRLASSSARLGLPEVTLGLIPGWGGTQRLARQIPAAMASQLVLTGDLISAAEAHAWGLVTAVTEPADLIPRAREVAGRISERAPQAIRAAKRAMAEGASLSLAEGLDLEQRLFRGLGDTQDLREGIQAFEERRAPQYVGQ